MNDYTLKENYNAPGEDFFKEHFQIKEIFPRYAKYMKGICADFGCNNGACTTLISQTYSDITQLVAVDINEKALEHLFLKKLPKIYCLHNNLIDLKMFDNTLDSAYSFQTLEHIYPNDLDKVVKEFYRVLKPNAWILINVPLNKAYNNDQHVSFFTPFLLGDLFNKHGFYISQSIEDVGETITLLAQARKENI
jgi:SAM-dependent methyltransferase